MFSTVQSVSLDVTKSLHVDVVRYKARDANIIKTKGDRLLNKERIRDMIKKHSVWHIVKKILKYILRNMENDMDHL